MKENKSNYHFHCKNENREGKSLSLNIPLVDPTTAVFVHLFELLKAFNEKLLIVFANIRVWEKLFYNRFFNYFKS